MDANYLRNYTIEAFMELVSREDENRFTNLFDLGPEFESKYGSRRARAILIDKIFGVASQPELQMSDKSIIYQAVSIFDRYYNQASIKFLEFKNKAKQKLNPEDS